MRQQYNTTTKPAYISIVVPGLGDSKNAINLYRYIFRNWEKRFDIKVVVFEAHWQDKQETFEDKLKRLVTLIDSIYHENNSNIFLVGTSAGGSLAVNAFYQKKDYISKLINVHGRLRKGIDVRPSLEWAAKNSKAFYDSVINCEKNLNTLTVEDKRKILTMSAIYDEIVPRQTSVIDGATNIVLFSVEHVLTGILSFTIFSKKIVTFLKS